MNRILASKEWNLYEKLAHLSQKYAIPPLQMNVQIFEWGGPDQIQNLVLPIQKMKKCQMFIEKT